MPTINVWVPMWESRGNNILGFVFATTMDGVPSSGSVTKTTIRRMIILGGGKRKGIWKRAVVVEEGGVTLYWKERSSTWSWP